MKHWPTIAVAALTLLGCADDFDPYNLITEHRLLGISATPPSLREDETTTLAALVTENDASFEWSWCPISAGGLAGYECSITQPELQALVDEALGAGVVEIPPFELGTEATAEFTYTLPEALISGFCDLLLSAELPEGVNAPDCEDGFEIQIRLETESDGERVVGVRKLALLFDDEQERNQNPTIGELVARDIETGEEIAVLSDAATQLRRERVYELTIDIPESSSESYLKVPREGGAPEAILEELTLTWFYEGGDLDKQHTGFIEDAVGFEVLRRNEWTTPDSEETPGAMTELFFVLRDNRGGVAFSTREIELIP